MFFSENGYTFFREYSHFFESAGVRNMDYSRAKEVFEQYLDGYDRENDKVKLKIIHTYGVVAPEHGDCRPDEAFRGREDAGADHCPSA